MAFGAATLWDVRSSGDDTNNGGGFDLGNASFATDLAATVATSSAPVVTSASYTFVAGDVGAWVYIKSGTAWTPGLYQIASVSAGAATLSAAVGAAVLVANNIPGGMNTVAGCATTASPTAGTWGVDYSQGSTTQLSFTDMVIGGTTTQFTSALTPVGKNFVGNVISVTSGTGFSVQRVQILSTSTITATCDKSLGTTLSTGGTGKLGWPLATPGKAGGLLVQSNGLAICNSGSPTVYTMSASQNAAGGGVLMPGGVQAAPDYCFGWATNRHPFNTDTRPQFTPSANSTTLFSTTSSYSQFYNLDVANPGTKTTCVAFNVGSNWNRITNCKSVDIASAFVISGASVRVLRCWADNAATAAFNVSGNQNKLWGCMASRGSASMGGTGNNCHYVWCISTSPKSATDAFTVGEASSAINCIGDGATTTGSGFTMSGTESTLINCIASNNNTHGFAGGTMSYTQRIINCAGYNNTTDNYLSTAFSTLVNVEGFQTLTVDPYTSRATLDFTTNNTAGGGASLRTLGFPAAIGGQAAVNQFDIGAYQKGGTITTNTYIFGGEG